MPDVHRMLPVLRKLDETLGTLPSPGEFALVQAPGRVNLIGEHTDYNGGHVLPAILEFGVAAAARACAGVYHRVTSLNYGETVCFAVGQIPEGPKAHWSRYVAGMLHHMQSLTGALPPMELLLYGNVPLGAGLSSSAALCLATGLAVEAVTGRAVDPVRMALAAQAVEHDFAGVQCGVMDQMASSLGMPDHALLLHCDTMVFRHIPLRAERVRLVLIDSGVRRKLAASQYNRRRRECAAALHEGRQRRSGLRSLCALPEADAKLLRPEVLRRRALHVVTENGRVLAAAAALKAGDWATFGKLLVASHASLRDLYEVSCTEMDFLVEAALAVAGTYGARMTGGGFGGCTINVVASDAVERFADSVTQAYKNAFNRDARIFVLGPGCRAGIVRRGKYQT